MVLPIYTMSGKKRPEYFSRNFDKLKHSFVIFGVLRVVIKRHCSFTVYYENNDVKRNGNYNNKEYTQK